MIDRQTERMGDHDDFPRGLFVSQWYLQCSSHREISRSNIVIRSFRPLRGIVDVLQASEARNAERGDTEAEGDVEHSEKQISYYDLKLSPYANWM